MDRQFVTPIQKWPTHAHCGATCDIVVLLSLARGSSETTGAYVSFRLCSGRVVSDGPRTAGEEIATYWRLGGRSVPTSVRRCLPSGFTTPWLPGRAEYRA